MTLTSGDLQKILRELDREGAKIGLKINKTKTKLVKFEDLSCGRTRAGEELTEKMGDLKEEVSYRSR